MKCWYVLCCLLFSTAQAVEVIELTYEKADEQPHYFVTGTPAEEGWKNAVQLFTDRAVTMRPELSSPDGESTIQLLMTIDTTAKDAELPDVLFMDLNNNRVVDEGERYALRPARLPESYPEVNYPILCAEKVPLPFEGMSKPFLVNVYTFVLGGDLGDGVVVPIGLSRWGCYRGRGVIDGVEYEAVLEDRNGNGVFGDFVTNNPREADFLKIQSVDAVGNTAEPLRNRIIADGTAYSVQVRENGKKLVLDVVDVAFGTVVPGKINLVFGLEHPDWGQQSLLPGEGKEVPAGTWKIGYFNLSKDEGKTMCVFTTAPGKEIVVAPGEKTVVDFDTVVNAEVKAGEAGEDWIKLSLNLATSDGSTFRGYYTQDERFEGIPFKIMDEGGKEVVEGLFKFG